MLINWNSGSRAKKGSGSLRCGRRNSTKRRVGSSGANPNQESFKSNAQTRLSCLVLSAC
jgi:hypothetical protein